MTRFNNMLRLCLFTVLVALLAACGKDSDKATPVTPTTPTDTTKPVDNGNFYKLLSVRNFQGDTTDNDPTAPKTTMYYSLEENKQIVESYQKTTKWDVSFSSLYSSALGGNNGKDATNFGSGNEAIGGILILQKAFDDVTDIPADDQFKTGNGVYMTDDAGAFGIGTGWYLYDFGGDIVGDKSYDKQHTVYAMSDTLTLASGKKLNPRTLVVRTATGNYAKIKMISVYKDALTIDKWSRNTPHMYFSFDYVLAPKGSKKFEIK